MKTYSSLFLLVIIYCCSLKQNNSNNNNNFKDTVVLKETHITSPDSVVLNFLNWHNANWEMIHSFYLMSDKNDSTHLINGRWGDSSMYFNVNFKGVEKFLRTIGSSNVISENYIENMRKSFKVRSIELDNARQWDGPPHGFSADEIFLSNEVDELVPSLIGSKRQYIDSNAQCVKIRINGFYSVDFSLSKYGNKWLIDSIN